MNPRCAPAGERRTGFDAEDSYGIGEQLCRFPDGLRAGLKPTAAARKLERREGKSVAKRGAGREGAVRGRNAGGLYS